MAHWKTTLRDGERGHWIPYLEWMITTSCDLACPGCDRFIDYGHNWTESFDNIKKNMQFWSKHLDPDNLTIIGGEPLIHPKIADICKVARQHFDHAQIEIFTNGLLFPKRPKLVNKLLRLGKCKLSVTYHTKNEYVRSKIDENIQRFVFQNLHWRQINSNTWRYKDLIFETTDPPYEGWQEYRQEVNGELKPYRDNDPAASYAACGVNQFPIIYNNRLYKCPPISMVRTHLKKFKKLDDPDWAVYLQYSGLDQDFTESDLEEFVDNIQKPHEICGMCPANPINKPQPDAIIKHKMEKI
jgi:organic radical activating enzyme